MISKKYYSFFQLSFSNTKKEFNYLRINEEKAKTMKEWNSTCQKANLIKIFILSSFLDNKLGWILVK